MYLLNWAIVLIVITGYLYGLRTSYLMAIMASLLVIYEGIETSGGLLYLLTYFTAPLIIHKFNSMFTGMQYHTKLELQQLQRSLQMANQKRGQLIKASKELEEEVSQTADLYEIARDTSKSLNQEEIFSIFVDKIRKHVSFIDCRLLPPGKPTHLQGGFRLFSLRLGKQSLGYLAVSGIDEASADRFAILTDLFALDLRRARLYQTIQELAITDGLTGIFVRRHILERFHEELKRSIRRELKLSFLMADIDHFKECNDRFGHLVGDVVLREVARIMKENIREIDLVGRYGGEEFSIVLPETDRESGVQVAERLRQAIEAHTFKAYEETLRVTISLGVSSFPEDGRTKEGLVEKADEALYRAKQAGRNRTCLS